MTIHDSPLEPIAIPGQSITELLFERLSERPGEVVLTDGASGREMTAEALIEAVRRLAGGLGARGFGAGRVVGLMAPNLPEYAVVFHAVAWAGGTVTTINPTYTAAETRRQLQDSDARLLVTVAPFLETARAAAEGTAVEEIAVIGEAEGATPLEALTGEAQERQAPVDVEAHVVVLPYSSGTTGLPKGVKLSHRNLVANVLQTLVAIPVRRGEATIAFLPFFHIYGMTVLMNAYLVGGGRLVTVPRFDLEQVLRLTQDHHVRRLYVVPPVVLALAKHPLVDAFDLSRVEQVFSGAAPLGGDVADVAGARIGAVVTQGYGMTELSPVSHATPLAAPRSGSVGIAVPNTQSRIVDPETLRDRDAGEEGELWVRGPQVMIGYLGADEATARTRTEDGWLRTGDLAMIDADGYVYIRDRVKELIKYKGFQIAPAEIEAELLGHPGIADAAVVGRADVEAGEVPVAFVVAAPGARLEREEVAAYLRGRLAAYKQLHGVAFVEEIPKTASGKILRKVLKERLAG